MYRTDWCVPASPAVRPMNQKVMYGSVIVVVVAGVLWLWALRRPANNENFPEGTEWLCTNPQCGNHFHMTMKELGEYTKAHYGQPIKCPKCNQMAVGAATCAYCGKVYAQMRGSNLCPYCGKPQPVK
jgi:hypothetical protein